MRRLSRLSLIRTAANPTETFRLYVKCTIFDANDQVVGSKSFYIDQAGGQTTYDMEFGDSLSAQQIADAAYAELNGGSTPSGAMLDPDFETGQVSINETYGDVGAYGSCNLILPDNQGYFYVDYEFQLNDASQPDW